MLIKKVILGLWKPYSEEHEYVGGFIDTQFKNLRKVNGNEYKIMYIGSIEAWRKFLHGISGVARLVLNYYRTDIVASKKRI